MSDLFTPPPSPAQAPPLGKGRMGGVFLKMDGLQLVALALLVLTPILVNPMSPANAAQPSQAQLEAAAKILCETLRSGQSPDAARNAARTYLLSQVEDKNSLSRDSIREQLRPLVMRQCPGQAMKMIGS